MSIEAELVIEQMKEHHHRDLCRLRLELEDKVCPSYQSCSLISLRSDGVLHVGHSQFFFLIALSVCFLLCLTSYLRTHFLRMVS